MELRDDLGAPVRLTGPPQRVVSLVPSITEALAQSCPGRLVGATDWCTHPADLDVARVRGTKNPDLKAIAALSPDLVVCNQEENRELDVQRLRDNGIPAWVTVIETVDQALTSLTRLFHDVLECRPSWLEDAARLWSAPPPAGEPIPVAVPIWRDPWMVVGSPTYTSDLLSCSGLRNVFADHEGDRRSDRYPTVSVDDIEASGAQVILLPDEPYVFTATDGPEAFTLPSHLVSGRLLTWYGPAMVEAHTVLAGLRERASGGIA